MQSKAILNKYNPDTILMVYNIFLIIKFFLKIDRHDKFSDSFVTDRQE